MYKSHWSCHNWLLSGNKSLYVFSSSAQLHLYAVWSQYITITSLLAGICFKGSFQGFGSLRAATIMCTLCSALNPLFCTGR